MKVRSVAAGRAGDENERQRLSLYEFSDKNDGVLRPFAILLAHG
jgi:hypothetical protein